MFRFENGKNFVEIDVQDENNPKPSRSDDNNVSVKFSINGFCGKAQEYLLSTNLQNFSNELIKLEQERKGKATLQTPVGDIFFEIRSLDNLGHFGIVCGTIEYGFLGDEYLTLESKAFLEIDPQELVKFTNEEWVSAYKS